MKKLVFILEVLTIFLATTKSLARPLQLGDVHVRSFSKLHVHVNKDLSYEQDLLTCHTLLDDSDEARNVSTLSYEVDLGVSQLVSLKAWTEIGGEKIPVSSDQIHKGNAAVSLAGFTDIEQYTISFPRVEKNARLCYQAVERMQPALKHYFEFIVYSPAAFIEKGSSCHIESEVPLIDYYRDSQKRWDFKKKFTDTLYSYTFSVKDSYLDGYIFENLSDASSQQSPIAILRSHNQADSQPFISLQKEVETRLAAGEVAAEILQFVESLKSSSENTVSKVEKVMAWVMDHIRYMGDWRTQEGRFVPHTLSEIMGFKYGDCKDFSLLTTKILRLLGIKAYYTLVRRGYSGTPAGVGIEHSLFLNTNHAIVYIDHDGGFFVDPTNDASIAAVLPDIMDRQALVFGESIFVKATSNFSQSDSLDREQCLIQLGETFTEYRCTEDARGLAAAKLLMGYFRNDRELNERAFVENNFSQYNHYKFENMPDFWDRQVKPVSISYQVQRLSSFIRTPLGLVIRLSEPFGELFDMNVEERVTGIYLPKIRFTSTYIYQKARASFHLSDLDCHIDSPWLRIERKIIDNGQDVEMVLSYETLRESISPQEFMSQDFEKLRQNYDRCIRSRGLVLKQP